MIDSVTEGRRESMPEELKPSALVWTNEIPTVPGWYFWHRRQYEIEGFTYAMRVVHVHYLEFEGKPALCMDLYWFNDEAREGGYPLCELEENSKEETWWSGPIPEPREPK